MHKKILKMYNFSEFFLQSALCRLDSIRHQRNYTGIHLMTIRVVMQAKKFYILVVLN